MFLDSATQLHMGERPSPYSQVPLGTARPTAPVVLTAVVVVAQKTEQMEDKRHELWRRHGMRAGGTRHGQSTYSRTADKQGCSKTRQTQQQRKPRPLESRQGVKLVFYKHCLLKGIFQQAESEGCREFTLNITRRFFLQRTVM